MEYMKGLENNAFDLAIVDPPYGMENKKGQATSRIKKYGQLKTVNDLAPCDAYFKQLFRVSKNQIIWGYNHLSDKLPSCREFIFWHKHQPVPTYSDGELAWTSFQKTAKCFDFPFFGTVNADIIRIHPTQKPVKLYQWLLKNYAKEGDKILDTHLGSGSSAIAAHYGGFDFVGTELDEDYYKAACERFDRETAQLAMF
jgi:site-specific DNA-methyltransferase (adenine-specific)